MSTPKMKNMQRVEVSIDRDKWNRLYSVARNQGQLRPDVIRRAVDAYLTVYDHDPVSVRESRSQVEEAGE